VPDPDGSEFTQTITWATRTAWKILSPAPSAYRYWTVLISDEANPDGYLSIGYLVFGAKTALTFTFAVDWGRARLTYTRAIENELGVPMVGNVLSKPPKLTLSSNALIETTDDIGELETLLLSLGKQNVPLLIIPDTAGTEAYFARLVVDWNAMRRAKWSEIPELEFVEDSHGVAIVEPPEASGFF